MVSNQDFFCISFRIFCQWKRTLVIIRVPSWQKNSSVAQASQPVSAIIVIIDRQGCLSHFLVLNLLDSHFRGNDIGVDIKKP